MFSTVSFRLFVIVFRCFRFKDDNFLKETCIELPKQDFRIYQTLYSVFYPKVIRGGMEFFKNFANKLFISKCTEQIFH